MALAQISKFAKYFSLYFTDFELYILSDPIRSPDIHALSLFCSKNNFLIIRNYGHEINFKNLKNKSQIYASINLKSAIFHKISGIHIPNKKICSFRKNNKNKLITTSAHNYREIIKAINFGANKIIISTIFESESKSAKKPMGILKLAQITRAFPKQDFIALGGINKNNVRRLRNIKIKGVAGVSFKI